jgi:GNAT superfamily N-acetyltransferase
MTIEIQPIAADQIDEAKRVILSVARNIYQWQETFEETVQRFAEQAFFDDLEQFQAHYFDRRGTFLVATDQGRVIGTGAIRQLNRETAELKRFWLLEAYQGKGIGYQMMQRLLSFARGAGYWRMRLQTDIRSVRAVRFYERIGFTRIACETADPEDVCMELSIEQYMR